MGRQTPLYDLHVALGARIVDFGGFDMPVNYGSQIEEHQAVRTSAGVFDVSHMCVLDLQGARTRSFLRYLLANDAARLAAPGKAFYSCMLNESGGVVDDLIAYYLGDEGFRLIVNAGTREKDMAWIAALAGAFDVRVSERTDLAMLAIQGPKARELVAALLSPADAGAALALAPFTAVPLGEWFVSRTGYTGEDGFELVLPAPQAPGLWRELNDLGVISCGLGARDTLRLEAGMNLYGQDMDEHTDPLESGLGWTIAWDPAERNFIGRSALEAIRAHGSARKLVGLVIEERAIMRAHQIVHTGAGAGEVTSGSYSPTLGRSIAFARVPSAAGREAEVEIRGRQFAARIVRPPFVRNGRAVERGPDAPLAGRQRMTEQRG